MDKHQRRTFAHESVLDSGSIDLELPKLHVISLSALAHLRESLYGYHARPTRAALIVARTRRACKRSTRRTRYRPGMARQKETHKGDVISRLADAGEDAVRALLDLPRRMTVGVLDRVEHGLRGAADRLRAIDPLYDRVVTIEHRLDSLSNPAKPRTHRQPTRAKAPTAQTAHATEPTQPEQARDEASPAA